MSLESCRYALERREMKFSRSMIEYISMNERKGMIEVRPARLYGLEAVVLTKREETELEVELKMLFSIGETRMDRIINE